MKLLPAALIATTALIASTTTAVSASETSPTTASEPAHQRRASVNLLTLGSARTLALRGHGYGHGHGMSQHGAEGAARQGLGYAQILDFYYPGTQLADVRGQIRVKLTTAAGPGLNVKARPGLVLTQVDSKTTTEVSAAPGTPLRLYRGRGGNTVLAAQHSGAWTRLATFTGPGQLGAAGGPVQTLTTAGWSGYRGRLRFEPDTGEVVNHLLLERYLWGVVPSEMPATWSPAAVQAQSVAARTYAVFLRANESADHYDLCDTTACQVYTGTKNEHPAANAAIAATRHKILTWQGNAAFTQFSASNGGWSSAGSVDYLVAKEDPYDGWTGNYNHLWSTRVRASSLEKQWPRIGRLRSIEVVERNGHGDWGGRVVRARLVGSKGAVTVTGDDLRWALGLRSNWFSLN